MTKNINKNIVLIIFLGLILITQTSCKSGGSLAPKAETPSVNPDSPKPGSLVDSFATNGIGGGTSLDGKKLLIQDLQVLSDNKFLITGSLGPGVAPGEFLLAKFNSDGSLDTTFGTSSGYTRIDLHSSFRSFGKSLAIQSDGKIIVQAAPTGVELNSKAYILRFTSSGVLDTTFATAGVYTYSSSFVTTQPLGLKLLSNGKIFFSFSFNAASTVFYYLLDTNGALDTSFDTDGILSNAAYGENIGSIEVSSNDNLYITGKETSNYNLTKLKPNGSLDTTFNSTGILNFDKGSDYETLVATHEFSNGNLLLLGKTNSTSYPSNGDLYITKISSLGSIITTFGDSGSKLIDLGEEATITTMLVSSLGDIYIGGGQDSNFFILKLSSNGSIDANFATNGYYKGDFEISGSRDTVKSIRKTTDNKLLILISSDVVNGETGGFFIKINP